MKAVYASLLFVAAVSTSTACDTDPTVPSAGCTETAMCPLGQLCNTVEGACVPEPEDGFAGFFSCTLYDDASHPIDPNDLSSITDVVGTLGPTRYPFYLDVGCTAYTKQNPPFLGLSFDTIPLGDQSDSLVVMVPWPTPTELDIQRATTDGQIGSGYVVGNLSSDSTYAPRLGFLTGGHLHLDAAPVPGTTLTGYLDVTADATPAQQPPLLSDCSMVGVAACGPTMGATCSTFATGGSSSVCTFPCQSQADCDPYGGICETTVGLCTKQCGSAADCPSFLQCGDVASTGTQLGCN
jgi:hypothetical protein